MRTAFVGQVRNLFLGIGLHKLVTMRTGIFGDRDTNGPNARVLLHSLERQRGGGEQRQVSLAVYARQRIIGGASITFGTGLHKISPGFLSLFYRA